MYDLTQKCNYTCIFQNSKIIKSIIYLTFGFTAIFLLLYNFGTYKFRFHLSQMLTLVLQLLSGTQLVGSRSRKLMITYLF